MVFLWDNVLVFYSFLQFLECVVEVKMVLYGVLSEYKIVMRFFLVPLSLCHDSSSNIASDEVQRIVPLTIFSAFFCIHVA